MSDGVNIEGLRDMYRQNPVARAFLDHAAQRERDRAETTVDRIHAVLKGEGSDPSRAEVVSIFQLLETLGCGKFIIGRRGKASRFAWSASIADVGRAAVGEQQTVSEIPETASEAIEASAELLAHRYYLRPEMMVSIDLPVDLTMFEADRLAAFIKSLPMEE